MDVTTCQDFYPSIVVAASSVLHIFINFYIYLYRLAFINFTE